jgi:hypothetical protein
MKMTLWSVSAMLLGTDAGSPQRQPNLCPVVISVLNASDQHSGSNNFFKKLSELIPQTGKTPVLVTLGSDGDPLRLDVPKVCSDSLFDVINARDLSSRNNLPPFIPAIRLERMSSTEYRFRGESVATRTRSSSSALFVGYTIGVVRLEGRTWRATASVPMLSDNDLDDYVASQPDAGKGH